ncbi:MAG TPA: DEAD/DEAH box helicase family protein [Bacteroidales bacterium]|nr:DEAD/DEAH box helicase family protein [Bacteroidales bacterium]
MANFFFLTGPFADFLESATEAEKNAFSAPRVSAFFSRLTLENAVRWLYDHDSDLALPYQDNLNALMYEQSFKNIIPPGMFSNLTYIRKLGNDAAHRKFNPSSEESFASLRFLYTFLRWLVSMYSENPPEIPAWINESLIPHTSVPDKTQDEIRVLEETALADQQELLRSKKRLSENEEEIARLKTELEKFQSLKKENSKSFDTDSKDYSEAKTRDLFINLLLREAGWDPKGKNVEEFEVQHMPNNQGIGYVDYVLWGDDGLPLAVVEAKKTKVDAHKGQHQAELYANCLEKMFNQRPVIFYTNGFESWIWDDTFYPPRPVHGFFTKDELQRLIYRRADRKDIKKPVINKTIAGRYYQEEAIRRVAETLEKKARGALLVMATGSGKTRISIAIIDMLIKAGWVSKALFLADRNALVTQAKNRFSEFVPHLTTVDITKEKEDSSSRMVFSTYPTMMNKIDGEKSDDIRYYSPGHFDLIIIDEAHRSVYMKYKAIFDYFDAIIIGLTATPKSEIDKNTYELFGLENHNPTYAYELQQAVDDKFLKPPKAVSVPMKFTREGIKYKELSEKEKEEYEKEFRDEETGSMPEKIDSSALNSWLFNKDTVDKVLSYTMDKGLKIEGGDKLGKTILFARSHEHALFIEKRFNTLYPHYHGKFLRVIDNYEMYAQDLLDSFTLPEQMPQFAVSVDMLDTGIDIPEIVNLVFFKPVRSSSKFWQMIGRGTRLCPDLFGPGVDKEFFYIFDFCENFEFFESFPDGVEPSVQDSVTQKIFKSRLWLAQALNHPMYQDDNNVTLRNKLLETLHSEVAGLDKTSFLVRMHLRYVDEYALLSRWFNLSKSDCFDITKHLASLIPVKDEDEFARRFDLLILNVQLAIISAEKSQKRYINQVINLAKGLALKNNIPSVAAQMEMIKIVQQAEFWSKADMPALERVRESLRDLIKFLDKENLQTIYTDFEDELFDVEEKNLLGSYSKMDNYRQRVERYIRENQHHITISKLKTNKPITHAELKELERILFDGHEIGTKDDFEKVYGKQPLGQFIRSIVGLDRNAAMEAFSEFLSKGNLKADQLTFINNIIDHLTINGAIDNKMLFEPPFTDINDLGIVGVFPEPDVKMIIGILENIEKNAVA